MARVTHVKKAQVRWPMIPVLDDDGNPVRTQVMRKDGVTPKLTRPKHGRPGRPIYMAVTAEDRTGEPKPNYVCDHCRLEILPGTPYKHITPRSGPYGGRKRTRHESCPTWQVWEYSSSLSAQLSQVEHNFQEELQGIESGDDAQTALYNAAEAIREIAEAKKEAAQNIEDGFGHPTSSSEELNDLGEQLESWADEVSGLTIPEFPEAEEQDCETCGGTGTADQEGDEAETTDPEDCEDCEDGKVTPDEPTDEQIEAWREEVSNDLQIMDSCPV